MRARGRRRDVAFWHECGVQEYPLYVCAGEKEIGAVDPEWVVVVVRPEGEGEDVAVEERPEHRAGPNPNDSSAGVLRRMRSG